MGDFSVGMTDEDDIGVDPKEQRYASMASDPDRLPGPYGNLPDWFTETDHQILYLMLWGHILTPAIIAENIERSRGAVSRRLQTLQAGEFVEKVDRGKYTITRKGAYTITGDPGLLSSDE